MEMVWLYMVLILVQHVLAVTWLYLAKQTSLRVLLRDPRGCERLAGLVEEQVRVCQREVEAMDAVRCRAGHRGEPAPVPLPAVELLHAAGAAGLWRGGHPRRVAGLSPLQALCFHPHHRRGRRCFCCHSCLHCRGEPERCGCDRKARGVSPEGFLWSGCSDNLSYRVTFSQAFVDNPERSRGVSSSRTLLNLHNEAERKALLAHMKVECKCHGVSGSCAVRTGWKVMPPFCKVGNVLKEKFKGATEVCPKWVGSHKLLVPKSSHFKPYTAHDLVYLLASPDPCAGVFGTSGCQCSRTSAAMDGCELLCCSRGFCMAHAEVVECCSCSASERQPGEGHGEQGKAWEDSLGGSQGDTESCCPDGEEPPAPGVTPAPCAPRMAPPRSLAGLFVVGIVFPDGGLEDAGPINPSI